MSHAPHAAGVVSLSGRDALFALLAKGFPQGGPAPGVVPASASVGTRAAVDRNAVPAAVARGVTTPQGHTPAGAEHPPLLLDALFTGLGGEVAALA